VLVDSWAKNRPEGGRSKAKEIEFEDDDEFEFD
jgi:hypothetical protein